MGRPSKGTHVLAKLRQELGLQQKEMADRVRLHWRTIQDIERGKLKLSRRNAIRISETAGVSINWLLRNDPGLEILNVSGKKWSQKDRQAFEARSRRWPRLAYEARRWELGVCTTLLKDYVLVRSLLEEVPNPTQASLEWHQCQKKALCEFVSSYEPLCTKKESELMENRLSRETIQTIRNDLDAISEALEAPRPEETLARLKIASFMAGTRQLGDGLRQFDELGETTPDGTSIANIVKLHVARRQQARRRELNS
jgi:DNA-binding XRE family transcriptional regulator